MEKDLEFVSYTEYEKLMETLTSVVMRDILYGSQPPEFIYGIARGGLPIAVHLSHRLNIPLIDQSEFYRLQYFSEVLVLVVDDIVDTGKTIHDLRHRHPIKVASLFFKPTCLLHNVRPDFYVKKTKKWVVFPWESGTLWPWANSSKTS